MRRIAMVVLLVAGAAGADSSVPAKKVVGTPGGWRGRCAERLERARDEVAKKVPLFAAAKVEAVAREQSEAGDPTAHQTVDIVELSLGTDARGGLFIARVEPNAGDLLKIDKWTTATEMQLVFPTSLYIYRVKSGLVGTLIGASSLTAPQLAVIQPAFKRAVDDCFLMTVTAAR